MASAFAGAGCGGVAVDPAGPEYDAAAEHDAASEDATALDANSDERRDGRSDGSLGDASDGPPYDATAERDGTSEDVTVLDVSSDAGSDAAPDGSVGDASDASVGGGCAEVVCNGQCVDVQTDPHNCGACGHDCQGGGCQGGLCQPIVLASNPGIVVDMAVSATNLYWLTFDGYVYGVPLGGGSSFFVSNGGMGPTGLAIDSTSVYWVVDSFNGTSPGVVFAAPIDGGPPVFLYMGGSQSLGDIAVDGTSVYWTDQDYGYTDAGFLMRVGLDGGGATTIASGFDRPTYVALDSATVYWMTRAGILRTPKAGGNTVRIARVAIGGDLAVDATNVYWVDINANTVMTVPKGGGTPTTLASNQVGLNRGFAADSTNVYWTAGVAVGALMTMPKIGGTPTTVPSGNWSGGSSVIVVDSTSIYWGAAYGGTSAIVKVAK